MPFKVEIKRLKVSKIAKNGEFFGNGLRIWTTTGEKIEYFLKDDDEVIIKKVL